MAGGVLTQRGRLKCALTPTRGPYQWKIKIHGGYAVSSELMEFFSVECKVDHPIRAGMPFCGLNKISTVNSPARDIRGGGFSRKFPSGNLFFLQIPVQERIRTYMWCCPWVSKKWESLL